MMRHPRLAEGEGCVRGAFSLRCLFLNVCLHPLSTTFAPPFTPAAPDCAELRLTACGCNFCARILLTRFPIASKKGIPRAVGGVKRVGAIGFFYSTVQCVVGFEEFRRHGETIVKAGEGGHPARGQVGLARGKHGLGFFFNTLALCRSGVRPREIVVNQPARISVT
jgi:hypothetical protein